MIANIQMLRAVAALAVVMHHLQFWLSDFYQTPHFALVGRAGVDLFFIISGFIMVHTTRAGDRSTSQFWTDRAVRIVPLYWLGTTIVLALYLAGLKPLGVGSMDAGDVVTSYLFIPDINVYGFGRPILDVGWTLNFEMFFYALFGITLFLRSQVRALVVLAVVFAAIWLFVKLTPDLPFVIAHYGNALIFEFLIGAAIALWHGRSSTADAPRRPVVGVFLIATALVVVFAAGWKYAATINDHPELRVAVFGGPSVLLLIGALLLERSGIVVKSRFLLILGAASYSIYLVHPLILQPTIWAYATLVESTSKIAKAGAIAIAYPLAVAAGVAVYLWVERPLTASVRALARRTQRSTLAPQAAG